MAECLATAEAMLQSSPRCSQHNRNAGVTTCTGAGMQAADCNCKWQGMHELRSWSAQSVCI